WTLVDTGLGLPDAKERWASELAELPGPVRQIVVTHFHPDHVGAAADLVELTGAPVAQGRVDYEQCRLVWDGSDWTDVLVDWFRRHGVPDEVMRELIEQGALWRPFIRFQPDPLGDYLGALEATIALDARIAFPGHGEPILDPSARVRALIAHHAERLAATAAALGDEPQTGYEVSFPLFGDNLKPAARRFAVAETLSHLERLVLEGSARRTEDDRTVAYTSAE